MKNKIIIFLIIILVIVLAALIMIALAFQDENTDKYNTPPSNEVIQNVGISSLSSNEAYISESELNSLAAYLIEQAQINGAFPSDCSLNAAYIELNGAENCRIYLQVNYKEHLLGFAADADIYRDELDDDIKIAISNGTIGKLKIPDKLLGCALSKVNPGSVSQYLSVNGQTISVSAHYALELEQYGTLVNLDITGLQVQDGMLYIQTNPIVQDFANNAAGILGEQWDGIKDKISSGFGDLF